MQQSISSIGTWASEKFQAPISFLQRLSASRTGVVLTHIGVWLLFLYLPFATQRPYIVDGVSVGPFYSEFFIFSCIMIAFFYSNLLFFIPKLLYKRNFIGYVLGLYLFFVVIRFAENRSEESTFFRNREKVQVTLEKNVLESPVRVIVPMILILSASFAVRFGLDRSRNNRLRKEQENENLKSELSFLRSQISPHFLFNVMNNVVALSRLKPQMVEPTLIQLSELLRYMLYEADEKKVSLEREVGYLESYIHLQQLRFGENVQVEFEKKIDAPEILIEPMLLIPFVENAFKHGVGMISNPFIKINLSVDKQTLLFSVSNKFQEVSDEEKDSASGIGLKNVKRRLELLYEKNQNLEIKNENEFFEIFLKIKLNG